MVATYTEGDEPVPGFRLVRLLGWGRFGEVWKATTPGGFEAAVKFINLNNKHGLKEFRAIRLFKQLRHPNLVPLMALWLKDKQGSFIDDAVVDDPAALQEQAAELIIAMGVGDRSLFDRFRECQERDGLPGIPGVELLEYTEQVGGALDYLNQPIHDFGAGPVAIQHCDIKPHNILLVSSAAQVCDLGVARILEDPRATAAMGSAAYVAPECISEGKPSSATDQYSLAITYFEMRTGSLPFDAKSVAAAYMAHMQGKLDLSRLPRAEQEPIRRATAVNPAERFPNIRALVRALRQATEHCLEEPLPLAPPRRVVAVTDPDPRQTMSRRLRPSASELCLTDTAPPPILAPTTTASSAELPMPTAPAVPEAAQEAPFDAAEPRTSPIRPWTSSQTEAPRLVRGKAAGKPSNKRKWHVALLVLLAAFLVPVVVVPGHALFSRTVGKVETPVPTADSADNSTTSPTEPTPPPQVQPPQVTPPSPPPEVSPATADVLIERGRQSAERGDYQAAVAAYSEALRLDKQLADVYLLRANARIELAQYDEAMTDCGAAIRLNERDAAAYYTRAVAALRKGDVDRAIADATEALDRNPQLAEAYFTRAGAWSARRDFANALADYDRAIGLRPRDTRFHHEKTHAYMAQNKLDLAIEHYTEMLRHDSKNAIAYAERGHAQYHRGRFDQALADCTEALRLDPRYVEAYCIRADANRQKRRYEAAIADCTTALRYEPRSASAYFYRGNAYFYQGGHYDEAIADYTHALELNPRFAEAYLRRGEAWSCQGKDDRARDDFAAAQRATSGELTNPQ